MSNFPVVRAKSSVCLPRMRDIPNEGVVTLSRVTSVPNLSNMHVGAYYQPSTLYPYRRDWSSYDDWHHDNYVSRAPLHWVDRRTMPGDMPTPTPFPTLYIWPHLLLATQPFGSVISETATMTVLCGTLPGCTNWTPETRNRPSICTVKDSSVSTIWTKSGLSHGPWAGRKKTGVMCIHQLAVTDLVATSTLLLKLKFGQQVQWTCRTGNCKQKNPRIGLRVNNWLETTRLPVHKIILFIYCWCYKLTSCDFCERELEISREAVVDYNSFLREVCAWKIAVANNDKKIGGFDCWNAYTQVGKEFEHFKINHSLNFIDPDDPTIHTQNVESMWRGPKNDNRKRMGTNRNFLESYMAEYMWRSSLPADADVFQVMLDEIKTMWPPGTEIERFEVNYFSV
uniref:ISXO2-like transposase domain-containing protein n=1 Tax=Ditylenchus dipsaci TaxID=166011 RepID=A0A915CNN8_9BILA